MRHHDRQQQPQQQQQQPGERGIPDSLLVGLLAFLLGLTILAWLATGLAGLFTHGAWPDGVTFARTPLALRHLMGAPHDIPSAWPDTPPDQLSGYGLFWGLLIGELMVLGVLTIFVLGVLARLKAQREMARARRPKPTTDQGHAVRPDMHTGANSGAGGAPGASAGAGAWSGYGPPAGLPHQEPGAGPGATVGAGPSTHDGYGQPQRPPHRGGTEAGPWVAAASPVPGGGHSPEGAPYPGAAPGTGAGAGYAPEGLPHGAGAGPAAAAGHGPGAGFGPDGVLHPGAAPGAGAAAGPTAGHVAGAAYGPGSAPHAGTGAVAGTSAGPGAAAGYGAGAGAEAAGGDSAGHRTAASPHTSAGAPTGGGGVPGVGPNHLPGAATSPQPPTPSGAPAPGGLHTGVLHTGVLPAGGHTGGSPYPPPTGAGPPPHAPHPHDPQQAARAWAAPAVPAPRAPRLLYGGPEARRPTAVQAVLDAEGPALVVTSDPTVWADTKDARAKLGPVLVYDPGHLCDTPARLHWSPTTSCERADIAAARAVALLAPIRPQARLDAAMADTAETLLSSWLHAAAVDGRPFRQVHRWAQGHSAHEPVRILRTHPKASSGAAGLLESALTAYPERREIAQELTVRALAALSSIHIREACTPNRNDSVTLESFADEGGTLYVVGEAIEDPKSRPGAMPLLTALTSSVVEHGRRMAARSSDGRLDPPMTFVLDDVAAVAPLPQLPELLSTGQDQGLPTLVLLRSQEQGRARWPDHTLTTG